jgi:16S rRNA processing protein RimM
MSKDNTPPSDKGGGDSSPKKRVCLARIATTHGVRGLVKLLCFANDPEILNSGINIYTSEEGTKTLKIKLKNQVSKYWIAEIEWISNKEDAEKYRGTELWINREDLPDLEDEDEFYVEDIVGMDVVDISDHKIGNVISVQNFGAGDLLEVKPISGGKTVMVTFTVEEVPTVDINNRKITLASIDKFIG